MKKLTKGIIAALLSLPVILSGNQKNDLDYQFILDGNNYSFRGSFVVTAEPDCLINLIYNFQNIANYTLGAKSIERVRQGDNWYEVTYIYRKFVIFENQSTWRRTLDRDDHKIVFEMLASTNNINTIPQMISSTGYYRIIPETEGCRVEYFQECKLKPGLFQNTFINNAKKEAIKFLQVLKKYTRKTLE